MERNLSRPTVQPDKPLATIDYIAMPRGAKATSSVVQRFRCAAQTGLSLDSTNGGDFRFRCDVVSHHLFKLLGFWQDLCFPVGIKYFSLETSFEDPTTTWYQ